MVDTDNYLLRCYRYIEMNPVRAEMVKHPSEYRWSSYRASAYGEKNEHLVPHDLYTALSENIETRQKAYRELFNTEINSEVLHAIRSAIQFSMPVGGERFVEDIERAVGHRIGYAKKGRPRIR
jgi:putative transposase